jgi:genome maintenance protein MGM101
MNESAPPAIEAEVYEGARPPQAPQSVARYQPTGRVLRSDPFEPPPLEAFHVGASTVPVTDDQAAILAEDIPDDDLEIKPTGEVYASQVRFRNVLNRAFKPMGWALVPLSPPTIQKEDKTIVQEWALYVGGRYVSRSWGSADYQPANDRMDWSDALEAAKSNALTRCCKDLGIAEKCWSRKFLDNWIAKNAVKVWVEGKPRPFWRHKNSRPFPKETRFADDSPNKPNGGPAVPAPLAQPPRAAPAAMRPTPPPSPPPPVEDVSQEVPEAAGAAVPDDTYVITGINSRSGEKANAKNPEKPIKWTRWTIEAMIDGGELVEPFHTFDQTVADTAKAFMDEARPCTILWEQTDHGRKATQIVDAEVGF